MADHFEPQLRPPTDSKETRTPRYSRLVINQAAKAGAFVSRSRSSRGPRFGRGGSAPVLTAPYAAVPGTRRVVVKARIVRHTGKSRAAKTHLHYLQRDGVTAKGEPGQLYSRDLDEADGGAFLARSAGERHQFRLIVAAEDGASLADLKPFIRDLMAQMEKDLGTKLDWVAADHHNTGHPHTHVVIAGRDERGGDLVMAKTYISHGIRAQAQHLVTLELGPETQLERLAKLTRETDAPRLTPLDRHILREARQNIWVAPDDPATPNMRAVKIARLKSLERFGLAREQRGGVFVLNAHLADKLKALAAREERYATIQRTLKEHGLSVPPAQMVLWRAEAGARTRGTVLGRGFMDDGSDRHYIVLRTDTGRVVHAELGGAGSRALPEPGAAIELMHGRTPGLAVVRPLGRGIDRC